MGVTLLGTDCVHLPGVRTGSTRNRVRFTYASETAKLTSKRGTAIYTVLTKASLTAVLTAVACLMTLAACSSAPTSLGISAGAIQSEFRVFDFERAQQSDGQSMLVGRKFAESAAHTGEVVELYLYGPEHDLTAVQVFFSTHIDHMDAGDVGVFIKMVAPNAQGMDWVFEGHNSDWTWTGFDDINGKSGDVHIETRRDPLLSLGRRRFDTYAQMWVPLDMILVNFTPR